MNLSNPAVRFLAILAIPAGLGVSGAGCEPRNDDINRVQPGYVKKAIFQTDDEWYFRRTVVKSETTNAFIIEGSGDIPLDRIKFEVQEDFLLAYKPYENTPGVHFREVDGEINEFWKGTVIAAWPIVSHFDIQRSYDALTGNFTNVISENAVDRPWHEREYIRVNWAANLTETSLAGRGIFEFPIDWVSSGSYWQHIDVAPTDPYASRFSDDYIEVTDNVFLGMDIFTCASFAGFSQAGFSNCGYGEAKMRTSFVRITEPSDYIPRDYPDSYVRQDADGNTIYDEETGEVAREPIYDRFGFFRTQTPTYDRGYGYTESGRLFRAMLHNLWERHTDAQGNALPYEERTPKPIVYYLDAEFPERYKRADANDVDGQSIVTEIEADYSRVFTSMVADLQGRSVDEVPQMFELRENDCNEQNIIDFVTRNPDLMFAVERAACAEGDVCNLRLSDLPSRIGVGNLKTVCTSLESATRDPNTGRSRFEWQRVGDARHKMLVWLSNPQQSGWGGYGPMHADIETGEVVSATSYIRGFVYEVMSSQIVDYIELINDEKTAEEIVYGQDIRRHVTQTLNRRNSLTSARPTRAALEKMRGRMDGFGTNREERLRRNDHPGHQNDRLMRSVGTRIEDRLTRTEDLIMASNGTWQPGMEVTDELRQRASVYGKLNEQTPFSEQGLVGQQKLHSLGFCYLEAQFDPTWEGMALSLRELPREERYRIVLERVVKHVVLHELGHNVGLAHNFEGSFDALNYADEFWDLFYVDRTASNCIDINNDAKCDCVDNNADGVCRADDDLILGRMEELRHTSVMEYLSSKGAYADFLGKYDEAALRFAYANQVQVFDSGNVDEALVGGAELRNWRYYNDYRRIPDHLCDASDNASCGSEDMAKEVVRDRQWVTFDYRSPPENEVPYHFCDNAYNRRTPFCATFDYGSDITEIYANYYSMWSDYFFFNNFKRDRLDPLAWQPFRALLPQRYLMFHIDLVAQYYYYLGVSDPNFRDSYLEQDMFRTAAEGLNYAAEVIGTPIPERMCPFPGIEDSVYISHRFLSTTCDEYADIDSAYARQAEAIQIPLGDGRPSTIQYTEDYEELEIAYIGSYFDKSDVIFSLGFSRPTLMRFNYDLDPRFYYTGMYRIFEDEMDAFYRNITRVDGILDRSRPDPLTAIDLGSYWCRNPDFPTVAHLGYFEPREIIDVETGTFSPGPPDSCLSPSYIYPELLANTPYQAMFAAHAVLSSDFDAQRDMGRNLKVYVVGSDDDFPAWESLPSCEAAAGNETCYCAIVDELTGLEYRALNFEGAQQESPGCEIVAQAVEAQNIYLGSNGDPFFKDLWRSWIERLEHARDLYRIFQMR